MATKTPKIRFSRFDAAWEQRKLGDIATLINGRAFSQNELLEQGKYPILRVGNFYTNGSWYFSNMKLEEKFYAARGDLLYTWSASFGPHIWEGEKVIFHYHIWKIELTEKLDKQFALFLLDKDKDNLLSGSNGSTMIHITKSGMEEKKLWIPKDKTEQKKIGTFLKKLEETITLHQKKLEHFKKLKESLLQNMFPREGEIFPRLRFPEFTDAWEQRKLGDLMDVSSVKRIHQSDWTQQGIPFYRARDIVAYFKNQVPNDCLYISKEKYEECCASSGKVCLDDLLVTGVGTIGVPYLIKNLEPLYFKDGNIIWFKNKGVIDGKFLYYSFNGSSIQRYIKESAGTGTVGTYTIENGRRTPIYLPSKSEQKQIGELFSNLEFLVTLHQRELPHH
ncbi:restriction endonuclease subunit S [Turicimonas muris]|uniref:restriction endonuclease subunit S n=1 Tax=Turicimonas muris TaxID=1796652 RepID=UPI00261D023F|nr:restriction endonuclease subunit S [Turicimonas muris]